MSANKQLMDALHRALAEGLMKEFELATESNIPPSAALAVYRMDH